MGGMGKERNPKMYSYVSKPTVKPARKICTSMLNELKGRLQEERIQVQIEPVGSARVNLVTKNGSDPFDLDYDIRVFSFDSDLKLSGLKKILLNAVRKEADAYGFRKVQDSTSAITCIHYQDGTDSIDFHMDIGIIVMRDKNSGCRLIHDKRQETYTLNEPVQYKDLHQHATAIYEHQMRKELRRVYLEKKNQYLKKGDQNHPSFVVYVEAVNQVYQKILNEGGTNMAKGKVSGNTHTQAQMNHHANQGNPNNAAHKSAADNRSNQMNPNHTASKGGKK